MLGMAVVMAAVVAGTVYFGNIIRVPLTASQLDAATQSSISSPMPQQTVFTEPADFDDRGVVMAVLAGGEGIAVKLADGRGYIQAYMPSGQIVEIIDGPVRVRGKLTEISCAYANTLFAGQCTSTVLIESIEQLTIQ